VKYAYVIIDTRPIDPKIIGSHAEHLPDDWELKIFDSRHCSIRNLNDYNRFLTSPGFWNQVIEYDRILIFQQDSMMLRPGIEEFLEWDLVGAPWKFQDKGGNGGVTIRNPKKCLELIKQRPWNGNPYEDVFFSNHLHEVGGVVAPREVCSKFACETIFQLGAMGYHAIDKYFTPDQCKQIRNQYL